MPQIRRSYSTRPWTPPRGRSRLRRAVNESYRVWREGVDWMLWWGSILVPLGLVGGLAVWLYRKG